MFIKKNQIIIKYKRFYHLVSSSAGVHMESPDCLENKHNSGLKNKYPVNRIQMPRQNRPLTL
jgi:hypothetical protein